MKRALIPTLATILGLAARAPAFAANAGGTGGTWAFVTPINNFAGALESITAALVVISLIVIIAQHMIHREDWGGMVRNIVFVVIGGAVIVTAANFMQNAGVTGAHL
jgi:formyltetrahydrofolate synthetase